MTGKPGQHATPLLTETMKFITVNPTWNVPPSIIYNEYLPALQQDPTVLQRMGLRLERARDGSDPHLAAARRSQRARPHSLQLPEQVSGLSARHAGQASVRQEERAVQPRLHAGAESDQYAATLLNITMPNERYTPEKIRSMYGHSEIDLKFPTPIPVNITYQTAFVDDAGKLQVRKDVYGRDATMLALLRTPEARIWKTWSRMPSRATAGRTDRPAGRRQLCQRQHFSDLRSSGPSFFERLFGGPTAAGPGAGGSRQQPQRRVITR